jgi:hypothetical protein
MSDITDDNGPEDDGEGNGNGNGNGRDYEIGYGKPPKHSQFKPGQSGNPRGPKKGSRGLKKDLHKALEAKHSIKVGRKVVKGTTQELALYTLAIRAAAGDIRAIRQLIDVTLQVFGPEDRGGQRNVLPKQDQELLDRLLEDIAPAGSSASNGSASHADNGGRDADGGSDEDGESRDEA